MSHLDREAVMCRVATFRGPLRDPLRALAARSNRKERAFALDALAFIGTVAVATVFRWQARDVIWGLWISSLTVGYATIVATIVRGARAVERSYRLMAIIGGFATLAFFTFHFGMFHFVHGVFLNGFFPLIESEGGFPSLTAMIARSLLLFWPLVLASFLSRLPDIAPAAAPVAGRAPTTALRGKDAFAAPYGNVVRMHLLIFVFAGLQMAGLSRFAIIPVLAAYFFPWRAVRELTRGR